MGVLNRTLQLNTKARLQRALTLYMAVVWRVAHLMRLGRDCPELGADLPFATEEWQAAYILNRKPVPRQRPKLGTVQRVFDFATGVRFMDEQRTLEE